MLPRQAEIIVIGGGVIGSSIAYHLAKEGKEVILLEKRNIASGASGRNGGQVIQCEGRDKDPELIKKRLTITRENNRILKELNREFGIDIEYQRIGSLDLAVTEEEWKDIQLTMKSHEKAKDKEIQLLDKKETLKLCPVLTDKIKGCRFRPSDGTLNPFFYTHGFAINIKKKGGEVFTHTAVKRIIRENGKAWGIETQQKRKVKANIVINATNAWAPSLTPEFDILPLRQVSVVTEPTAHLPVYPMEAFIEDQAIYTTTQDKSGNLVAGGFKTQARKREAHFLEDVAPEELAGSTTIFPRLFKGLEHISIIRSWAGTMAVTGDCIPCIGKVPECRGLFIAAGFSAGMAYGAIVGRLMSELICKGKTSLPMELFSPQRFYKKKINWPRKYNYTVLAEFFARK